MTTPIRRTLFALALAATLPIAGAARPTYAQVAPQPANLSAVVRDGAGAPVPNADVEVTQRDADDEVRTTTLKTDAQGRFELPRSQSKFAVEALIHKSGYALQRAFLKPDGDSEITLKAGVLASGKVVDAQNKPVAGARVKVTFLVLSAEDETYMPLRYLNFEEEDESVLSGALEAQTDADGNWQIADLPAGSTGRFELEDPRFARADTTGILGLAQQSMPDLKAIPGANLKGRVVDAAGKPVAKAKITVVVGDKQSRYAKTTTAPDGTYALQSLPAGDAKVQVVAPGGQLAPASLKGVAVAANQTATAPEIKLDAGVLLTGKVTDKATKKPIAGAQVMAQADFGDVPSKPTGVDGLYKLRVPAGQVRFYLFSRPEEYVREMGADANANVTATSKNAPDFAITRGLTLTGTARDETGAPAQAATILAGAMWDGAQTSVDAQGNWTLVGVNAKPREMGAVDGKVRLTTDGDWQIVGDGLVAAREGTPTALVLRRIERQDVTLRVVTPQGEPIEGAQVRIAVLFDPNSGSTRYETAISNARGEVTARRLRPEESAEITPTKEGYALQKAGVITALSANKARATDAILTPKNEKVRGRVLDVAGVPVVGARVAVLWPGDARNSLTSVQSDADGKFELSDLRAGELILGAARGRDFGQVTAQTGGDIEIKLAAAAPQPAPLDRARARQTLEQWFADAKQNDEATLVSYAADIAGFGGPDSTAFAARSTDGQLWFEREQTPQLAQEQQARKLQKARAAVDEPKKLDEHQRASINLAALLVQQGDLKGARETYESVAPNVTAPRGIDPDQAMWDAYKYAQLAAIAGAIEHPGADYWVELLDRSLDQMSADERSFRIGGYAETLAKTDPNGAEKWLETRSPAEQVLSYEEIIPIVANRDLPRAQELLAKMEALVARGDIPVEPDRNDAMYRPKPAHSLNVARGAIIGKLLPLDARAAYEQAQKMTSDNYLMPDYQTEAALLLPKDEALPILRAQFVEAQDKDNRSVAAMARLAKLVAPFDAKLSEQWFDLARQKLAEDNYHDDQVREMAAPYAFYRADSDPAQSRLLLENEWQRTLKNKADDGANDAARLRLIGWAMVPLDFERSQEMMRQTNQLLGTQYDGVVAQHNMAAWLLASEPERREMNFDGASATLFE